MLLYALSSFMAYFMSFYQPRLENKLHRIVDRITHKSDKYVMVRSKPVRQPFDPASIRPAAPKQPERK